VFDPRDWDDDLKQTIAPGLFTAMVVGAQMENALKLYAYARKGMAIPPATWIKATSASEYAEFLLEEYGIDLEDIATELPDWFLEAAVERLVETFAQDYWEEINDHTADSIETIIRGGISDGKSTREVAKAIGEAAPERAGYRAMNAARTETGNALNYGHHTAIQQLEDETGIKMGSEWLSVCGSTSREEHCGADGTVVPLDETFDIGGYEARWPGDELLPPEQRCNCQCTIVSAFAGEELDPDDRQRIQEQAAEDEEEAEDN
jgi:hypothetical protein